MQEKARENLEAARILLERSDPCTNAAATRAYYGAYQACWSELVARFGETIVPLQTSGERYFRHRGDRSLPVVAERQKLLDADGIEELEILYGRRVTADYYLDDVLAQEALDCVAMAERLITRLLGEEAT